MKKQMNLLLWSVVSALFVLASVAPLASQAQILRNLGKRVEQKVEEQANRRIERQIDKAIDKSMDKVEQGVEDAVKGEGNKNSKSEAEQAGAGTPANPGISMGSLFGGANIAVKDQYLFALGISYDMTSTQDSKAEQLPGTTLWLASEDYLGVASSMQQNMFMVIDGGGMITFMENEKRYLTMGMDMLGQMAGAAAEQAEASEEAYTFSRVGSEAILGQPCEIYEVQTEDGHTRVWVTQALDVAVGGFGAALSSMMRNSPAKLPDLSAQPAGVMLKMESTIRETGQHVVMEATELHRDGKTFKTAGYERMGM